MKCPPEQNERPEKLRALRFLGESSRTRDTLQILLLAAAYFIAAKFGLTMAAPGQQVTILWPPSGIALAAVLLLGNRVWPGIALGAIFAELSVPEPALTAAGIATGNTLEALAGAWLLRRYVGADHYLDKLKGVIGFIFFAALLSTMISATIGAASLCLSGLQPWTSYQHIWHTWWIGDADGCMIFTPLILAWCTGSYSLPSRNIIIEVTALVAVSIAAAIIVFMPSSLGIFLSEIRGYPYMIFPLIIWAALRFGPRGITVILMIISSIGLWATSRHIDPFFAEMRVGEALLLLQIFFIINSGMGLLMSAVMSERLATEKQLQEDWQCLQNMLSSALDAVVSINQEGLIDQWNVRAEEIFEWSREEVVGKPLVELIIPPPYRAAHLAGVKKFLTDGSSKILGKRVEMEAVNKQGETFPVELSVVGQKLRGCYYFTAFIRDLRHRRQSEKTKGFLASLVEFSDEAIIGETPEGIINVWNVGAEKLFGYSVAEAMGKDIGIIIPPEKKEEEKGLLAQIKKGLRSNRIETVRIAKDGRRIDVSLILSPVFDYKGKVIGASKIIHDITERKDAEKSLLHYTESLKRSNQELDDFAYVVSHDLKEPLRGLQSFSQFLLEDYEDKLDEEGKKKLHTISALSKRLEKLLETLLYYSRLGRTDLAMVETDLNDVVRDVIGVLTINLKEKNTTVEILQKLPVVMCDRIRVRELFQNLIGNALKYNDNKENKIEISYVKDHPRAPGEIVFYVRDHGIGIAEKHLEAIFKIFKRLHTSEAYGGGTGSGLAIVRKIVTQHGGKIWAESKGEGQGTTFFFTLPQK